MCKKITTILQGSWMFNKEMQLMPLLSLENLQKMENNFIGHYFEVIRSKLLRQKSSDFM